MDNEKIGKYIRKLRLEKGISQNELGEIVHVTRQAISCWENGKNIPDSDVLVSLSNYFGVSINDILSGNDKEKNIEEVALELVDENNKKTATIRKMMVTFHIIIYSLLIVFLGIYFIANYNSIKVYKVSGATKNFRIQDGLIISTSKNTFFKLGNMEAKGKEDITIAKVKLYYEVDGKKEIVYESDMTDRMFAQFEGYNELYRRKFEKCKDSLYLEITYNESEVEIMKLEIKEKYKNDYLIAISESNIAKSELEEKKKAELQIAYTKEKIDYEIQFLQRQEESDNVVDSIVVNAPVQEERPVYREPEPVPNKEEETIPESGNENNSDDEKETASEAGDESNPEEGEETTPTDEEDIPQSEEPNEEKISYDEISDYVESNGTPRGRLYVIEVVLENGTVVCISSYKHILNVEVMYENYIESWMNVFDGADKILYQKFENYVSLEKKNISLVDNSLENEKLLNTLNEYILLVYKQ